MASSLLSELVFGSYLVYSPRGRSEISERSRRIRDAVKTGREETLRNIAAALARDYSSVGLDGVLGPDVTLVPAPRSGVLVTGGLWPSRLIADALASVGLASSVVPALLRTAAVPKSAFQPPGERPTAERHYETIQVDPALVTPRITVVDDIITKGNTLLGAASRLAEAFPTAKIAAFALLRTMGLQPDVETLIDPCVGTIRLLGTEASRNP